MSHGCWSVIKKRMSDVKPKQGPHFTFGFQKSEQVLQSVRESPPAHYLLKIESFSFLNDSVVPAGINGRFESTKFTVGGHEWILSIYPKGNLKDDGRGYISMYCKVVNKLGSGHVVNALLNFFVYDHIRNEYLVIQVKKCFDGHNTECGVPKFIPQDAFSDPSNGFLVNDRCVFGAEIFVESSPTKYATLSLMHKPKSPTYTWKIDNFSELLCVHESSFTFTTQGCSWKLIVYPKGCGETAGKSLSLFLWLQSNNEEGNEKKAYVKFSLCCKNQLKKGDKQRYTSTGTSFLPGHSTWGWWSFLPLSELNDPSKGFKVNDVVIFEATIMSGLLLKEG